MVAGKGCAASHAVMLAFNSALAARRAAIGPARFQHERQTCVMVRKLGIEVFERVLLIAGNAIRPGTLCLILCLLVVKG